MQKKILITVDGSIHANYALAYVACVFQSETDVVFTLLNIQPMISQYLLDDARTDPDARSELDKIIQRHTEDSERLLQSCKQRLCDMGVPADKVLTQSRKRQPGQVKSILEYANKDLFDALVIGRRGLTRLQKLFMGSTSAKIMEHAGGMPVWVIDGDIRLKNALVCLDTSAHSMRVIDYIAAMADNMAGVELHFFHVEQPPEDVLLTDEEVNPALARLIIRTEEKWHNQFWPEAVKRMTDAGIRNELIHLTSIKHKGRIAKAIMSQIETGHHDTVILGRSGSGNSFYFGRVARYVAERVTERALWLIG